MSESTPFDDWQAFADKQREQFNLPALSIAVWKDGVLKRAASGVLNLETGVEATPDSIFQIGSITKAMTASLVMRLVDRGCIELDVPVRHYLRDFRIADKEASERITVRQLLDHTSGIPGDFFVDDHDKEGNLIARFVDCCNALPLAHPVGKMTSYSNTAYSIAGRLVEVVTGIPWAAAMREEIFEPLGMTHAIADPKDVLRFRAAIGHVSSMDCDDQWEVVKQPYLSLGQAPCGATPMMRAHDLIGFARAFLNGGRDENGNPWLAEESVTEMTTAGPAWLQISDVYSDYAGLGWSVLQFAGDECAIFQHGGATPGFLSRVQASPSHDAAFAILLNGRRELVLNTIAEELSHAIFGLDLREPDPAIMPLGVAALSGYCGLYEALHVRLEVKRHKDGLIVEGTYKYGDDKPPIEYCLKPLGDHRFAAYSKEGKRQPNIVFAGARGELPDYLCLGKRWISRQ